jgi:hypothetical protein
VESLEAMCDKGFQATRGGVDLNGKMEFRAKSGGNTSGDAHEHRQDVVRPTDGFSLALAWIDKGSLEEARQVAAPVCASEFGGPLRSALDNAGLCR